MKILRTVAIAAISMSLSQNMLAQETKKQRDYKPAPYMFVGVQGGTTRTFTNSALDRKWAPMGALSFGAYVTPWLGARIQGNGWTWDEDFLNGNGTYSTKQYGGNADLLVNLTGLLFPHRHNLLGVVILGGYGMQYAKFGTDITSHPYPLSHKGNRWMHSARLGGQLDFNVARHFGVQVEGGYDLVHDHIHAYKQEKWWPYLMAGINFKFGHPKDRSVAPRNTQVLAEALDNQGAAVAPAQPVVEEKKPEPKPQPVAEQKKPEPKVQPEVKQPQKTTENIFFDISSARINDSQMATIAKIAEWAKSHPGSKIQLTGYADRNTGNARLNQNLSEQRAAAVRNALVRRGIESSRITSDAKGDTVQPFSENDQNRAVIVIAEE